MKVTGQVYLEIQLVTWLIMNWQCYKVKVINGWWSTGSRLMGCMTAHRCSAHTQWLLLSWMYRKEHARCMRWPSKRSNGYKVREGRRQNRHSIIFEENTRLWFTNKSLRFLCFDFILNSKLKNEDIITRGCSGIIYLYTWIYI